MAGTFALRFIAGKYKGGEFPLRPNREITVGRGSEFDMVLDEDMVSRRHAKIVTFHGQIVLQDLKSTNGTFLNGERISVARLKAGDKLLIGSSMMELVEADTATASQVPRDAPAMPLEVPARDRQTGAPSDQEAFRSTLSNPTLDRSEAMSGRFPDDDVTVADLVELFSTNRRTGVLVLGDAHHREGRIFFRDGQVYFANLAEPSRGREPSAALDPRKCFFRLLTWLRGSFRMDTLVSPPTFERELSEDTRGLLVEGLRQWDELKRYAEHLPRREDQLALAIPLEPRLSALSPEALDTLQLVLNCVEMGLVLDYSEASDLETSQDILYLLQNAYIVVR